jgi:hypothetical protein
MALDVEGVVPPTGSGNHRPDGPQASHVLTFKLDHSSGAERIRGLENSDV